MFKIRMREYEMIENKLSMDDMDKTYASSKRSI